MEKRAVPQEMFTGYIPAYMGYSGLFYLYRLPSIFVYGREAMRLLNCKIDRKSRTYDQDIQKTTYRLIRKG